MTYEYVYYSALSPQIPNIFQVAAELPGQGADLDLVPLSWEFLLPDLPRVFLVDITHSHYHLYQEAFRHVEPPLPPPYHDCKRAWGPEKLSDWPPSISTLTNLLADQIMLESLPEGLPATIAESILDLFVFDIMHARDKVSGADTTPTGGVVCVPCLLQARSGRTLHEAELHQAELLYILAVRCDREPFQRRSVSRWSPMPWSSHSRSEGPMLLINGTNCRTDCTGCSESNHPRSQSL